MKIDTIFSLNDVLYTYDDRKNFFRGVVVGIIVEAELVRNKERLTVTYTLKDRHGDLHHHKAESLATSRYKQLHPYYPHGVSKEELTAGPVIITLPPGSFPTLNASAVKKHK